MERRRFQRLRTRVPILGRAVRSGSGIEGHVMNMSEGGFSFESNMAANLKGRYDFEITAPPEADRLGARFQVRGEVRWCAPSGDREGAFWIGVMFEPSGQEQQKQIREFVSLYTVPEG